MRFLITLFLLLSAVPSSSFADIPLLINYQARLTDANGDPLNGFFGLHFALYSSPTGPAPIWNEDYDDPEIMVENGLVSVILGSRNELDKSVFLGNELYLGIRVGGDMELSPRHRIVSTPFALSSLMLDGKTSDDFEPAGAILDHNTDPEAHPNRVTSATEVSGVLPDNTIPSSIARTTQVQAHAQDFNNPHKVSLTQAAGQTHHGDLLDVGTKTHATIDSHIDNRANPHVVRSDQLACPEGMVDAGAYCIEMDERVAKTWAEAAQVCRQAGRRLCSPGEWAGACLDAQALGLKNMTGNREWVDNWSIVPQGTVGSEPEALTFGLQDCTDVDNRSPSQSTAFRCCE